MDKDRLRVSLTERISRYRIQLGNEKDLFMLGSYERK